jgi:hypothetical protein
MQRQSPCEAPRANQARGGLERRSFHSAKAIELEEIEARVAAFEKEAQVTEQTL